MNADNNQRGVRAGIAAVLLAGILAATTAAGVAGAVQYPANAANEEPRTVEVVFDSTSVDMDLRRTSAPDQDEVEVDFEFSDGHDGFVQLEYDDMPEYEMQFEGIVEFADSNVNGVYDPEDSVVSAWLLGEWGAGAPSGSELAEWQGPTVEAFEVDGKSGERVTVDARLGGTGGLFTFRMAAVGDYATIDGMTLRPTGAKLDVTISDYPFVAPAGTELALVMEIEHIVAYLYGHMSPVPPASVHAVTQSGRHTDANLTFAFAWNTTAVLDTGEGAVRYWHIEDGDAAGTTADERFSLTYGRAAHITHDFEAYVLIDAPRPANGTTATDDASAEAPGLAIPTIAVAATGVAIALARARGRPRP